MEDHRKPTKEDKVEELFLAYKNGGMAGIKDVLRKRNEDQLKSLKEPCQIDPKR
jgi:hypothetical protein